MTTPVPAVQVLGAGLLVQGSALINIQRALRSLIRAHRRETIAPPPEFVVLLRACEDAVRNLHAQSGIRPHDTTSELPQPDSDCQHIGTKEVAHMLGVTQRHAQRLAPVLDGRRLASGAWVFDRDAVTAYLHAHHETRGAA